MIREGQNLPPCKVATGFDVMVCLYPVETERVHELLNFRFHANASQMFRCVRFYREYLNYP